MAAANFLDRNVIYHVYVDVCSVIHHVRHVSLPVITDVWRAGHETWLRDGRTQLAKYRKSLRAYMDGVRMKYFKIIYLWSITLMM